MEDPISKNELALGSDGEEAEGPTPPKKGRQANGNAGLGFEKIDIVLGKAASFVRANK